MLARLLFGEALVCHMLDTHVDQVVHIAVGERAVRITPFAIMLVKLAVLSCDIIDSSSSGMPQH